MAPTIRSFRRPTRAESMLPRAGPNSCGSSRMPDTPPRWRPLPRNTSGVPVRFCAAIWAPPRRPSSHDARLFEIARQRALHHLEQLVDIPRPLAVHDLVPEDVAVAQQAIAFGAEDLAVDLGRLVAGQVDDNRCDVG